MIVNWIFNNFPPTEIKGKLPELKPDVKIEPHLKIIEEPKQVIRFRYKTEVRATCGSLHGESSQNNNNNKTFPTVELRGYNEPAVIQCSLFQTECLETLLQHPHKLIVREKKIHCVDPHHVQTSSKNGYIAV